MLRDWGRVAVASRLESDVPSQHHIAVELRRVPGSISTLLACSDSRPGHEHEDQLWWPDEGEDLSNAEVHVLSSFALCHPQRMARCEHQEWRFELDAEVCVPGLHQWRFRVRFFPSDWECAEWVVDPALPMSRDPDNGFLYNQAYVSDAPARPFGSIRTRPHTGRMPLRRPLGEVHLPQRHLRVPVQAALRAGGLLRYRTPEGDRRQIPVPMNVSTGQQCRVIDHQREEQIQFLELACRTGSTLRAARSIALNRYLSKRRLVHDNPAWTEDAMFARGSHMEKVCNEWLFLLAYDAELHVAEWASSMPHHAPDAHTSPYPLLTPGPINPPVLLTRPKPPM